MGNGFGHTNSIPNFKRASIPTIAPLHGIVDIDDIIANLRNSVGRIDQCTGKNFPEKFSTLVIAISHGFDFFTHGLAILCQSESVKTYFFLWTVFPCFEIKGKDPIIRFLIKSCFCFGAQIPRVHERLKKIGNFECFPFRIIREVFIRGPLYVDHGI